MLRAVVVSRRAVPIPRKVVRISIFTGLFLCLTAWSRGWAQDAVHPGGIGGTSSYGISSSYSPNSSRILIGEADQRRTWTASLEYTRLLRLSPNFRLDYEGSLTPFYLESDPTIVGSVYTVKGKSIITPQLPERVLTINHQPLAYVVIGGGKSVPLYALYKRQNTYATSLAPFGLRLTAKPRWPIQPSFALNLGFVISSRDLPINLADQFNYMFALGPGVQVFTSPHTSMRLDYLYRHISNAHQGFENPGVDQGVFRLTLSRHR